MTITRFKRGTPVNRTLPPLFMPGLALKSAPSEVKNKDLTFELKASDSETNVLEGYASTFGGDPDSYGDVIEMGAFAKTIKERGHDIKFLWQHDWNQPIGKIMEIYEDAKGLFIKVRISETTLGKDAMKLIKDKVINKMSIGYSVIKQEWDSSSQTRTLKEIKLYEVSAVTFPANENAIITGAKNQAPADEPLKAWIDEVVSEIKAGRVLSDKNKTVVVDTVESLKTAVGALEALLAATDSDSGASQQDEEEKAALDAIAMAFKQGVADFTQ